METAIWIAQGLLAAVLLMAGSMKLAQPKERLAAAGQAWVEDFDAQQVKGIGALEVLAAAGLIVPGAFDLVPILTALAASGVALLMLGAGATHLRRVLGRTAPPAGVGQAPAGWGGDSGAGVARSCISQANAIALPPPCCAITSATPARVSWRAQSRCRSPRMAL